MAMISPGDIEIDPNDRDAAAWIEACHDRTGTCKRDTIGFPDIRRHQERAR